MVVLSYFCVFLGMGVTCVVLSFFFFGFRWCFVFMSVVFSPHVIYFGGSQRRRALDKQQASLCVLYNFIFCVLFGEYCQENDCDRSFLHTFLLELSARVATIVRAGFFFCKISH